MFTRFDTIHRCDRRTRGYRAMAEAALCAVSCGKKTLSRAVDLQSMRTTDDFIARSLQRAGDTIHSRHAMPAN